MPDARAQFGPVAKSYLTSGSHANERELAYLVRLVGPRGGTVVDVGTGAGHTAYAFASYVDRVVATDITPEMLAIVQREAKQRGQGNIETALMPAKDLQLPDASVQGVTCRTAAHHFSDVMAFLREVHRILVPGGWFLLVDTIGIDASPGGDQALDAIERTRDPSHCRNLTPSRWRTALEAAGFDIGHFETVARSHGLKDWLDRMRVVEPTRTKVERMIVDSSGALREYLAPAEEGDDVTFHLHQAFIVARKSTI